MKNKMVSLVVPVYNGTKFISVLIESILQQTYSQIELIIVDDGSTDKLEEYLLKYESRFNKRGYKLKYFFQPNQGQAVAVSYGLKQASGDYISWPDCDDFYSETNSVETLVEELEVNSGELSVGVCCDMNLCNENYEKVQTSLLNHSFNSQTNFFEETLYGRYWIVPGRFLFKMDELKRVIPNFDIYINRQGQNWQLLLPIMYNQKVKYVDKKLFTYFLHQNSHSRQHADDFSIQKERQVGLYDIEVNTLERISDMPNDDVMNYKKSLSRIYAKKIFMLTLFNSNKNNFAVRLREVLDEFDMGVSLRMIYKIAMALPWFMISSYQKYKLEKLTRIKQ